MEPASKEVDKADGDALKIIGKSDRELLNEGTFSRKVVGASHDAELPELMPPPYAFPLELRAIQLPPTMTSK